MKTLDRIVSRNLPDDFLRMPLTRLRRDHDGPEAGEPPRVRPWQAAARRVPAVLLCVTLGGCASFAPMPEWAEGPVPQRNVERSDVEKAKFYWPYAALAVDVYSSRGASETRLGLISASPIIRKSIEDAADEKIREDFRSKNASQFVEDEWKNLVSANCANGQQGAVQDRRFAVLLQKNGLCKPLSTQEASNKKAPDVVDEVALAKSRADAEDKVRQIEDGGVGAGDFEDRKPEELTPAFYTGKNQAAGDGLPDFCKGENPPVPVSIAVKQYGWSKVREVEKYTISRGWKVFVPNLAIDVWRRDREDMGAVEYAIVYRGTVGYGGWVSNLRLMTTVLPLFWDQYLQAREATEKIVEQIHMLHALSDHIRGRQERTKILITTVGHSLGAGIAQFVYYSTPEITRVVGFNPSPITGARTMIEIKDRPAVMDPAIRSKPDIDETHPAARESVVRPAIYLLYEHGEALSRLHSCKLGITRQWGDDGGPATLCEKVNLLSGNIFRQHSMAELGCKLAYLASQPEQPAQQQARAQE